MEVHEGNPLKIHGWIFKGRIQKMQLSSLSVGGTSKNQLRWLFEVPYGTLSIEGRVNNQRLTIQAFMFPSPKPPSR